MDEHKEPKIRNLQVLNRVWQRKRSRMLLEPAFFELYINVQTQSAEDMFLIFTSSQRRVTTMILDLFSKTSAMSTCLKEPRNHLVVNFFLLNLPSPIIEGEWISLSSRREQCTYILVFSSQFQLQTYVQSLFTITLLNVKFYKTIMEKGQKITPRTN